MTHINAFYGDVEEAKKVLDRAKADLSAAVARLEAKKLEDGLVAETPVLEKKELKPTLPSTTKE